MDKYLRWESQTKVDEGDDDIVILEKVEVLQDMTSEGPMKGQKYLRVTWVKLADNLIFHLQSGKCRIVQFDYRLPGCKPAWMGEHERAPTVTSD